jgi:hypothetical protein
MYRLFKKHGLRLSGLRSHGEFLTDEDIARKRALADELRRNPQQLEQIRNGAYQAAPARHGAETTVERRPSVVEPWVGPVAGLLTAWLTVRLLRRKPGAGNEEK